MLINDLASNCLSCKAQPCTKGCPLSNDITNIIKLVKEEKYKEAYELSCQTSVLQSICGRICPHTKQCEGSCIKKIKGTSVEIGKIEALLGDMAIENDWKIPTFTDIKNNKKVAIIGGGPAGLTCAAFLARKGFNVTIYEKHSNLGGIIEHSIPEFRLDKNIVKNTINKILDLGIEVKYNQELGKNITLENLENEYDAIFLSFGKNISSKMKIEGEELNGVYGGNELLEYKNFPNFKDKNVAIIGGGNVAIDTARTIKRLGANTVTIIYRRSKEEMPAEDLEIKDAKNDNIEFLFKTNILKILGNEKVERIECIKTELITIEGETRKVPINIENSNFEMNIDYVVMALGAETDKNLINKLNIETTNKGTIKINEKYKTSKEKIFAGGDLAGSKGTVAWAAMKGREAAKCIEESI